jgi:hypothetical protein
LARRSVGVDRVDTWFVSTFSTGAGTLSCNISSLLRTRGDCLGGQYATSRASLVVSHARRSFTSSSHGWQTRKDQLVCHLAWIGPCQKRYHDWPIKVTAVVSMVFRHLHSQFYTLQQRQSTIIAPWVVHAQGNAMPPRPAYLQ